MRKPDGLSAEDAVQGRSSLSALLSPGDFPATRPQILLPGMRRKSVIPRPFTHAKSGMIEDAEDEDEDEVDNCPDLMGHLGIPEVVTPAQEKDEPNYIESGEIKRTPTSIPIEVPLPIRVTPPNPPGDKAPAAKTGAVQAINRTTPRKTVTHRDGQAKKGAASVPGVARPLKGATLSPAGSRVHLPSSAPPARDALADLHTDNGQAGAARGKEERRLAIPYSNSIAV